MPSTCLICKCTAKGGVLMHRIPSETEYPIVRQNWLISLNLTEDDV